MKTKSIQILNFLILTIILLVAGNLKGQTLQANNDILDLVPGIQATINLLANDIIPAGDSIKIITGQGAGTGQVIRISQSGGNMTYLAPYWGFGGNVTGSYELIDLTTSNTSSATILFRIHDHSYDSLYLNNINALFSANGSHFYGEGPKFEVPKFSGKSTIFLNTLWIGGLDSDSILHLCAQIYGQGPNVGPAKSCNDFWAGPVMDSTAYSIYQDTIWNYVWNLKKSEIEYHKSHWSDPGYTPIHDILTWPGNGNVALGQAAKLAPFYDVNGDGIYNPYDGDYPLIKGDQSLFFIFNDDRNYHSETNGNRMKMEIHGMAYAFDLPGDSAFYNTIFVNYTIFNRSARTYYHTYVGLFTDTDIGWAMDDYIGCDVERSSYFGYNGTPIDGNGQPEAYGAHPPAQSVTILGGPYLDPDGIDNPCFDAYGHQLCNASVNGTNFGDSIVDNERYGMTTFVYFNNNSSGVSSYMVDPILAPDYYQYML